MKKEEIDDVVDFIFDGGYSAMSRLSELLVENKSLEEQRHFYLDQLQQKENIIKELKDSDKE